MSEGLPEGTEIPDAAAVSEWITISVRDTGIGVPEDQFEHIFGLFTQADGSLTRPYEGAGIGLALARSLVRLHGGTITFESIVDEGSTFSLILPVADEPIT